jgi:protein deglycase
MASPQKKVLVPITEGTETVEAVALFDVLRRTGADVIAASVGKEKLVEMTHGVKLVADALISNCVQSTFDLITLLVGFREKIKKDICDSNTYCWC